MNHPIHHPLLQTRWPLIQAPMAGCQDEGLALAVSAAGALGSLPAALLNAPALEDALQRLQASGRPYALNFFAHAPVQPAPALLERWQRRLRPFYAELGLAGPPPAQAGRRAFDDEAAELLSHYRPSVVSFHFGLPVPALLARVRATGARILSSATTLQEALFLQRRGVDGVIAQGLEAGGHRGHFLPGTELAQQRELDQLLPALLARLAVPVIAAGGIATAQRVQQLLAQGATAVQVGTAFLLCDEASTPPLHRARLRDGKPDEPTVLTNVFTGGVARGLPNRLSRELGALCADAPPFPWAGASLAPLRQWAEAHGRDDFSPLWAGSRREGLRAGPAAAIVRALMGGGEPSSNEVIS
ncbi:NAD(P)H-dependent flavin oxidoreductase [Paucibacter soli]|uniref:NAD(P)H-dependent flavin oxidoreductase n=1 Tax=Paucibacter soli TaxID=3133433 RepID=UPI0030B4B5ED